MGAIVRRWNIKPFSEFNINYVDEARGVYVILNRNKEVQYVGRSVTLRTRLLQQLREQNIPDARYFRAYQTRGEDDAIRVEDRLIERYNPPYNVKRPP